MFGTRMNWFDDYPNNDTTMAEVASLNLRANLHARAKDNIAAAQKRQITAQNNRERVEEDDIHKGDTVYVKDPRPI